MSQNFGSKLRSFKIYNIVSQGSLWKVLVKFLVLTHVPTLIGNVR